MEQVHKDRLAEHVEALARHALAGEVWPSATAYSRQAGTASAMRSNYNDAAAWHRTALEACRHLGAGKDALVMGIEIRFELYGALLALADHKPIFEVLNEAERLAEALGDFRRLSRIHGYLAMSKWWVADYGGAIELATRAIDFARNLHRPGLEGIGLWLWVGHITQRANSMTHCLASTKYWS